MGYPTLKLSALLLAGLLPLSLHAAKPATTDPLANYYENTLACQNQQSKAVCRLWLNRDGRYYVFYDLGPQAKMADIDGPFRIEGREGTFTLRRDGGKYQLCLWVAAPRILLGAEREQELFSEARCYPFTPHQVGDRWSQSDPAGRDNTLWLLKGR